jgi:hypothetical protein
MNHTSPSIEHHSRSVPSRKKTSSHGATRGARRDAAQDRGEERLVRVHPEEGDERHHQKSGDRIVDDVAVAVEEHRVDRRAGPERVDPQASVQQRVREQDVVVVGRRAAVRDDQREDRAEEPGEQAVHGGSTSYTAG